MCTTRSARAAQETTVSRGWRCGGERASEQAIAHGTRRAAVGIVNLLAVRLVSNSRFGARVDRV